MSETKKPEKETQKVTLYVQAVKHYNTTRFVVEVNTYKCVSGGGVIYINLSEVEVEVPIPTVTPEQLTNAEVDQLNEALQKEMADHHVRVTAIRETIQSLLSLENKA